jgi:hypothetical protein
MTHRDPTWLAWRAAERQRRPKRCELLFTAILIRGGHREELAFARAATEQLSGETIPIAGASGSGGSCLLLALNDATYFGG